MQRNKSSFENLSGKNFGNERYTYHWFILIWSCFFIRIKRWLKSMSIIMIYRKYVVLFSNSCSGLKFENEITHQKKLNNDKKVPIVTIETFFSFSLSSSNLHCWKYLLVQFLSVCFRAVNNIQLYPTYLPTQMLFKRP